MHNRIGRSIAVILMLCVAHGAIYGQGFRRGGGGPGGGRGPGGGGGPGRLESAGLKVGTPMPKVTVFDAEGKPFETASLEGKYSVIVFGCLT